jgi:hypothetical protein
MQIQDQGDERILSLCGIELNRMKLVTCRMCGAPLGPARYLDYIRKRVGNLAERAMDEGLCAACGRNASAKHHAEITAPGIPPGGQEGGVPS